MTIGTAMQSYHSDRKSEGGRGAGGGGDLLLPLTTLCSLSPL